MSSRCAVRLEPKVSRGQVSVLGDGLTSIWRWDYSGGAVCHASEDDEVGVARRLVESVVLGAFQHSPAHDAGGRARQPSSAKIV